MLRVAQIIPTLDRAGAEKQMVLLARGLPRDRFAVEVAALTRLGPYADELRAAEIPVVSFAKRHKADPLALTRLTRWLKRGRFDIVHTWIFAANAYGRVAARWAKVPVVVTSEMAVDLWKSSWELAVDRRLAAWTDAVVGNSDAVVDFYRRAGLPESKLKRIYSGIEVDAPLPPADRAGVRAELGLDPEAPLLIFAGRLAPQKGVGDLIRALDVLGHIIPDMSTAILGEGPLRSELEEMVRGMERTDMIRFLGHRADATRFLASADALVLPSLYEGLPNVVLEAMRLGTPVVATAAPGTTELVEDRVTGLLVPIGDPSELTRALREILRDRDLARRLAETARARILTEFRADTMIARFAELYEELARGKAVIPRT